MADNPRATLDPLPSFAFQVQLNIPSFPTTVAYFKSVSGIKYETEVVPVVSGGVNTTTYNLVGATKWSNIVLKQGFTKGSALLQWREQWLYTDSKNRIQTGTITQLDTALNPVCSWTFYRGWPVKWEITDYDASKSELQIESLEIAHDGLKFGG